MCAKVVDKKEKRNQILMISLKEFAKKGFSRTTINDIAKASGIGKGTVYEYFSNKEEIIHETFRFFYRALEPDFEAILISDISAEEKLKQILGSFTKLLYSESLDLMELMFEFWAEGIKDKGSKGLLYNEMKQFYQVYREIFADIIIEGMSDGSFRKDLNPQNVASVIVGALDGLLVQWLMEHETLDFSDLLNSIILTFLKGIARNR